MLFNSVSFLIFFPIVVLVYFIVPKIFKNLWLLISSYYFYTCWRAEYALLIFFSTVTTYLCALLISKVSSKGKKRAALILSLVINLSILFLFKYYDFFTANIAALLLNFGISYAPPTFSLLLPVGISFYTFQALGYSIDVYRGDVKTEPHFINYALFVSFFPQLVAGPIERSKNLLPQFREKHSFDYSRVCDGLGQMAWGFFKKMVIADNAALLVTLVYTSPTDYNSLQLIIATVLFAFQVYCDFSGYSDIAIGAARVLDFNLMRNFNKPYFAKSTPDFWSRWHISLSTWFQDYIYMPVAWSRWHKKIPVLSKYLPEIPVFSTTLLVFFISGLWHGASWTFVVWGLINGIYVAFSRLTKPYRSKLTKKLHINKKNPLYSLFCILLTFSLITFSYIFFRANTMSDALYIVNNFFVFPESIFSKDFWLTSLTGISFFAKNGIAVVGCTVFMLVTEAFEGKGTLVEKLNTKHFIFRILFYYIVLLLILFFGNFGKSPFVYFDF